MIRYYWGEEKVVVLDLGQMAVGGSSSQLRGAAKGAAIGMSSNKATAKAHSNIAYIK
jgi:hypothetical protein